MKALFIPFAPSLAHVSRCLAVAEAWRAKGHTTLFAVGAERDEIVRSAGFETRPVPEVTGVAFRTDKGFFSWLTPQYFADSLDAERQIMAEFNPDVVVFDFRFTTALAARLAGRPSVSIMHGSALIFASHDPRETGRLLVANSRTAHGMAALSARVIERGFPFVFQRLMRMPVQRLENVLNQYHNAPLGSVFELTLGDQILAADLAEFLPPNLPTQTHIVGPLMWSGWEQPVTWLEELDDRPLVYVTMGSTIQAQDTLVKIIKALGNGAYNVVVGSGSTALPKEMRIPSNIHVLPSVPGLAVAQKSIAVIHHGGHETLMQALAAGVPSLILPANPDQMVVAHQAQELGVGVNLWQPGRLPVNAAWQKSITPADIRRTLDCLMADPCCKKKCEELARTLNPRQGAEVSAKKLEEFKLTAGTQRKN